MNIVLGALAPSLSEQLDGYLPADDLEHLDKDADAITRLYIRGLMTKTRADAARGKLCKEIGRLLRKAKS